MAPLDINYDICKFVQIFFSLLLFVFYVSFINLTVGEILSSVHKKLIIALEYFSQKFLEIIKGFSFYFDDYINYKGNIEC